MEATNKHILLIDDDRDDHLIFEVAIQSISGHYNTSYARNGLDGLRILNENRHELPDVVFLDLNMPVMSGEECLKKIRSNSLFDEITVVIYSTSYHHKIASSLYRLGANFYICKPRDIKEITEVLKKCFSLIDHNTEEKIPFDKFVLKE